MTWHMIFIPLITWNTQTFPAAAVQCTENVLVLNEALYKVSVYLKQFETSVR